MENTNQYIKKEAILDLLFNTMPYLFWKGENGKYQGVNVNQARAFGFSKPSELIGKTIFEVLKDQESATLIDNIDGMVMNKGTPVTLEETILTPQGEKTYLSQKHPMTDSQGNVIGLFGFSMDVTELKQKKEQAEKERDILVEDITQVKIEKAAQQAELEAHVKFRKIVDQMAHDIGSPLMALNVLANSCLNIPEDERIMLIEAISKINDIANSLLREYQIKENDVLIENELSDLLVSTTLEQLIMDKKYEYQNLPVKFKYICNPGSHFCFIQANAIAFKRMISNLLNNAVDALEGKLGQISVVLESNETEVKILISDNGKGMPQEVIDKILNNVSVTFGKEQGHGIGLTQVCEALKQNHGVMAINSKLNLGTAIILTFTKIATPSWIIKEISLGPKDTIIILDDDKSIHNAWNMRFKDVLSEHPNLTVKHFELVKDVINFINKLTLAKKANTILLSDYELLRQGLNGLQVIDKVKIKTCILVTSHYANSYIRKESVKILPKLLASEVPIKIRKLGTDPTNV